MGDIINQSFDSCNNFTTPEATIQLQKFPYAPASGCPPIPLNYDVTSAKSIDSSQLINNFKTNIINALPNVPTASRNGINNSNDLNSFIDTNCSNESKEDLAAATDLTIMACNYKFLPNISKYDACVISNLQNLALGYQTSMNVSFFSKYKWWIIGGITIIFLLIIAFFLFRYIRSKKSTEPTIVSPTSSEQSATQSPSLSTTSPAPKEIQNLEELVGGNTDINASLESTKVFWCTIIILTILFLIALQFR